MYILYDLIFTKHKSYPKVLITKIKIFKILKNVNIN